MGRHVILGASGQDGAYLARRLIDDGHSVIACMRPASTLERLQYVGVADQLTVRRDFNLEDPDGIVRMLAEVEPDVVFNLAATGDVARSFTDPLSSVNTDASAIVSMLEAGRQTKRRFQLIQASSSEMFGGHASVEVGEGTPLLPSSPYGAAKAYCHLMVGLYRRAYGLHTASAVLFNHESPLRSERFVTRKITQGFARLMLAGGPPIRLGNLDGKRDWSSASDIADALARMAEIETPEDFVFASGKLHSVREFIQEVAAWWGRTIEWRGEGVNEVGILAGAGQIAIEVDPAYYRPVDPVTLRGDISRAKSSLGWSPSMTFPQLCQWMAEADARQAQVAGEPSAIASRIEELRNA